jgi:microcompartment protein CcmK/EutM
MLLGKVVKKVVSTIKHDSFATRPLLLVQPISMDFKHIGAELLCIDFMGTGIGEYVLVNKEGGSINDMLGTKESPADAAIVAIVDTLTMNDKTIYEKSNS